MADIHLYATGRGFYSASGSMIGLLYEVGTNARFDWGFVEIALERGASVHIRPANAEELARVVDMMQKIDRDRLAQAKAEGYRQRVAEERFASENRQRAAKPRKQSPKLHGSGDA